MGARHRIYLALGSNLGDRKSHLEAGLRALAGVGVEVEQVSGFIRTRPVGGPAQGAFLNGAVRARTDLEPLALLRAVQAVERAGGRDRSGPRWGPRTLDIDILLYDDLSLDTPELVIPHPRMGLRSFVLEPLVEVLA